MPDSWYDYAKCLGMDTEIFFGEGTVFPKMFCSNCPVIESCREEAVKNHLRGVWGGTTESERESIRRKRRVTDPSKRKPFCAKGHEFTPENTYERPNGDRQCRTCNTTRRRARAAARPPKPAPTHCRRGHEWKPETTYVGPRGARVCRTCRIVSARARKERLHGAHR